jgi:4,5-dihydroxyphthalate decarboxylase
MAPSFIGPGTPPPALRVVVDDYGHTRALLDGSLTAPDVALVFERVAPISSAFRPMVADLAYDVSEMAIATLLQEHAVGSRLALLPIVLMNRFHHGSIVRAADGPLRRPEQLVGRRVGVRSYAQTTAVWVRAILQHEHGVSAAAIGWVVRQRGHVAAIPDPANVVLDPGADFAALLRAGAIDAWVAGRDADGIAGIVPLIADPEGAARAAFAREGIVPINHVLVVRADLLDERPALARALVELFRVAKERHFARLRADGARDRVEAFQLDLLRAGIDPLPSDVETLRPSLETMIRLVTEQQLVPASTTVDALFAPYRRARERDAAASRPITAPEGRL